MCRNTSVQPNHTQAQGQKNSSDKQAPWKEFSYRAFLREEESIGRHRRYANGDPRPLMRGYLHGVSCIFVAVWWIVNRSVIEPNTIPVLGGILFILTMSTVVHLLPFKHRSLEFVFERLDKCGIMSLVAASSVTALLTEDSRCRTSVGFTVITQIIPCIISILMIAFGDTSVRVFLGPITACLVAARTHMTVDSMMCFYTIVTSVVYGLGLFLYAKRVGGVKPVWGYHEWMHVFVCIAMYTNFQGAVHLIDVCRL